MLGHEVKGMQSAKEDDPAFRPSEMRMNKHPKLAKKFKLLYQLKARPGITSNQKLADLLGVSRQSVSKWGTGSGTQSGDAIPDAHFFRIGRLFGIDSYLFTLEYEEFDKEVRMTLDRRHRVRLRPPGRIFNNDMPLTEGKLLGREIELEVLNDAWNQCSANMIQITGVGGVGKSSLVNEWLAGMEADNYRGAETVFTWSFHHGYGSHSPDSSSERFFSQALSALGDAKAAREDPANQVMRLVREIRRSRTLLVLDGVQNLQHCYGPNFGQFADPAFALLVRELVKENSGLCILSTRLKNADLEAIGGPRAVSLELGGLDEFAGKKLLSLYEVNGEPNQVVHAVRQHEGLPLGLRLLGKHLDLACDGNLAQYMEIGPLLEESGERERATQLARDYLDRLPLDGQRRFFYLLSLYQRSVRLKEVLDICRYRRIDGLTREILSLTRIELRYGIFAMENAGIVRVGRQRQGMILEMTRFAGEAMALDLKWNFPKLWTAGNRLLFDRMRRKKTGFWLSAPNREILYRAVINGVRSESLNEALDLYFRRLRSARFFQASPDFHYLDQACLRTFFADPWLRVGAGVSNEESRVELQFCAAANFAHLGDIDQATTLARGCLKWFLGRQQWTNAVSAACLLLGMFIMAGRLPEATRWSNRIRKKLAHGGDPVTIASGDMLAANVLFLRGKLEKAGELFRRADRLIAAANPDADIEIPLTNYHFCRYLLETGAVWESLKRSVPSLETGESGTWQISFDTELHHSRELFLLSLVLQRQGDQSNARRCLDKQVEMLRSSGEWICLAGVLNYRARFFIETEDLQAAQTDLDEALGIAQRMAVTAVEWETLLNLALLCSRNSKLELGRRYLNDAKEVVGMDKFRFRDGEIRELELALAA